MNYTNQVYSGKLTLSPGERRTIKVLGTHIRILSSTSETALLVGVGGAEWHMGAGQGMPVVNITPDGQTRLQLYREVSFYNYTVGETITVEFALSLGELNDSAANIRGSVQIDPSGPMIDTPASHVVGTDAFTVLQADARIKERFLQNNGMNPVWWGGEDLDPDTGRGIQIFPDSHAIINCWGAVYLKATGGETTLSINNVLKVS